MLHSKLLSLRPVEEEDLTIAYRDWLNDPSVNKYLEVRFSPQTMSTIREYWESLKDDPNTPWFAICERTNGRHIGNIKLGPIDWTHRRAEIGLFIGERSSWGKGLGSEAINLVKAWSFQHLGLMKLTAGMYAENKACRRAFEKCGFILEGTLEGEAYSDSGYTDVLRMGITRGRWVAQR